MWHLTDWLGGMGEHKFSVSPLLLVVLLRQRKQGRGWYGPLDTHELSACEERGSNVLGVDDRPIRVGCPDLVALRLLGVWVSDKHLERRERLISLTWSWLMVAKR
jgi:hypothetical protein